MRNFFYYPPLYFDCFWAGPTGELSGNPHAIRLEIHKKILPPERKAGNFFQNRPNKSTYISYKLNQSQLLSGIDSNRSQPKSGNDND